MYELYLDLRWESHGTVVAHNTSNGHSLEYEKKVRVSEQNNCIIHPSGLGEAGE